MPNVNEKQLRTYIEQLAEKTYLFAKRDQRLAINPLIYTSYNFGGVIQQYWIALHECGRNFTDNQLAILREKLIAYLATVDEIFKDSRPRFLTGMRKLGGTTFVNTYKQSQNLLKMLDASLGDTALYPTDVPEQQRSSPIYAKIENGRIELDAGRHLHPLLDQTALTTSRNYLKDEINRICESLDGSNIDRRFIESFSKLKSLIAFQDDAGAIALGLHVRLASNLLRSIGDEVSEPLSIQIDSTLTHLSYLAAQYKNWVEFVRNAQNYPPREKVEMEIDSALENVSKTLYDNSETVDQEVSAAMSAISSLLKGSKEDRANAIYAGIRGIENICIAVVKYGYEQALMLLKDTTSVVRTGLTYAAAAAILVVTLKVIADFLPVIQNTPELNWILENLPKIEKIKNILK